MKILLKRHQVPAMRKNFTMRPPSCSMPGPLRLCVGKKRKVRRTLPRLRSSRHLMCTQHNFPARVYNLQSAPVPSRPARTSESAPAAPVCPSPASLRTLLFPQTASDLARRVASRNATPLPLLRDLIFALARSRRLRKNMKLLSCLPLPVQTRMKSPGGLPPPRAHPLAPGDTCRYFTSCSGLSNLARA